MRTVLNSLQAVTDLPCALFGPELISAYPDAKVILNNREVDSWYKSCSETVFARLKPATLKDKMVYLLDRQGAQLRSMMGILTAGFLGAEGISEENAKRNYLQHYEDLRKIVPKDNLLEYRVQDGWAPLCRFLEVDKPESDFPWINEAEFFHDRAKVWGKRSEQRIMRKYGPVVLALCFGAVLWVFKDR